MSNMRIITEHDEQVSLFKMLDFYSDRYPALKNMFAIPNGSNKSPAMAGKFKAEGLRSGVCDTFLAVGKASYESDEYADWVEPAVHGLFIEMKIPGGRVSENQKDWITRLNAAGYLAVVCWNWVDAWNTVCRYLGLPEDCYAPEGGSSTAHSI
jgi:VRR-NUC domain